MNEEHNGKKMFNGVMKTSSKEVNIQGHYETKSLPDGTTTAIFHLKHSDIAKNFATLSVTYGLGKILHRLGKLIGISRTLTPCSNLYYRWTCFGV